MHYLGVPTCPYCKKRVNLIRTWSLKRQGEYQCPRCGGISNIYLSPLVYVLALLAVFGAGAMYFFHKFVLDDITLETALYVFIPFVVFFLFSVFMVYLEKPVIKKVSKEEYQKKRSIRTAVAQSANVHAHAAPAREEYYDDDYVPRGNYRPGPDIDLPEERHGVVNQAAFSRAKRQAAMENSQGVVAPRRTAQPQQSQHAQPVQRQAVQPGTVQRSAAVGQRAPQSQQIRRQGSAQQRPVAQRQQTPQQHTARQAQQRPVSQRQASAQQPQQGNYAQLVNQPQYRAANQAQAAQLNVPRQSARVVEDVKTPVKQSSNLDRYENLAYVQRQPREMEGDRRSGQ